MRKTFIASLLAAGLLATGLATSVQAASGDGTCDSSEFCAYDGGVSYTTLLLESRAGVGSTRVDVADNRTSSFKNKTNNCWKGISVRSALPDQVLLNAYPQTSQLNASTVWNDKIDHFDVRASC